MSFGGVAVDVDDDDEAVEACGGTDGGTEDEDEVV